MLTPKRQQRLPYIIGAVLLAAAPIWVWLIAPVLTSLPTDFSLSAELVAIDDAYNQERGTYTGGVYSKIDYTYETISSKDGVSTIRNRFTVRTPDDEPISAVERSYGVNQKTGAYVLGTGDKSRAGFLFAPHNVGKEDTFTYWHVSYDAPATMKFAGEEELYGLKTFRFETRYEGEHVDQTKELGALPGVGETTGIELEPYLQIWVEPLTGRLIKYRDDTIGYYYDLATHERISPWNYSVHVFQEQSVESNVSAVEWERAKAQLVAWYIPGLLILLGGILLLYTTGLLRRVIAYIGAERMFAGIAWFIVLMGAVTFACWAAGLDSFLQIFPGKGVMNPLTALCFVVSGIALLVRDYPRISVLCGLFVSSVAGLQLLASLKLVAFNPDLVLFSEHVFAYGGLARMSPYDSISFLCLGLVPIIASRVQLRHFHLGEILSSIVLIFSFTTLASVLFDSMKDLVLPIFSGATAPAIVLFSVGSIVAYIRYREHDDYATDLPGLFSVSSVLLAAVFTTMLFAGMLDILARKEAYTTFADEVNRSTQAVNDRVHVYTNALESAQGFFTASIQVFREEWKSYVSSLDIEKNYPGMQGMGYAAFVTSDEREAHSAAIRAEGFPEYTIRPEGVRDLSNVVVYFEPFNDSTRNVIGFDMYQDPIRRAAMDQARDTGESQISGLLSQVQELDTQTQLGFVMYVPLYKKNAPHNTIEERRANIVGYTYSPFSAKSLIESLREKTDLKGVGLRVTDGANNTPDSVLYDDTDQHLTPGATPRFIETRTLYIAGRVWILTFTSTPDFGTPPYAQLVVPTIVFAGILISALLAFMFYTLTFSRQRALSYAEKVTEDLLATKQEVEERLQSTERLNKVMVDRELKMREMKEELRKLKGEA